MMVAALLYQGVGSLTATCMASTLELSAWTLAFNVSWSTAVSCMIRSICPSIGTEQPNSDIHLNVHRRAALALEHPKGVTTGSLIPTAGDVLAHDAPRQHHRNPGGMLGM